MQCPNKFLVSAIPGTSTSTSIKKSLNSSIFPFFCSRRIKIQGVYHSPGTHHDNHPKIVSNQARISLPSNVKIITSTSNPFVKHCVKLRQSSSYRHLHGLVVVVGITPISEIYSFDNATSKKPMIECLFVLENEDIPEEITQSVDRVILVSPEVIRKISGVLSADSVNAIALFRIPKTFHAVSDSLHHDDWRALFTFPRRILVLDGIQDPGNLGTLIRSAKAFGWDGVFLLPGCCDPFNDKAVRACRGACFQIPIVSGDWALLETLGGEFQMKMFAGHSHSKNWLSKEFVTWSADWPLCLVLGSEGGGISERSRQACELVAIPMAGEFESLNVSVAGGIFMYLLQDEKSKRL